MHPENTSGKDGYGTDSGVKAQASTMQPMFELLYPVSVLVQGISVQICPDLVQDGPADSEAVDRESTYDRQEKKMLSVQLCLVLDHHSPHSFRIQDWHHPS